MESEDGKYMIGSLFIVEGTRAEAEAFNRNDPFYEAGVWEKVTIARYISIPGGIKPVRMEKDGDDMTTIRMMTEFQDSVSASLTTTEDRFLYAIHCWDDSSCELVDKGARCRLLQISRDANIERF